MKRLALFAIATGALVACGDDGGDTPIDAPAEDADETDAMEIDAVPTRYTGSITILEAAVLNPGAGNGVFGQGAQISVSFVGSDTVPGPILQQDATSALGCKAWEYTAAQAAAATVGLDEGLLDINVAGTNAPMVPDCVYTAGVGYICPHTGTAQVGGVIAAGPSAGQFTFTDLDTTFSDNNSRGRYLRISGAATAGNNGVFPILSRTGANTLTIANAAGAAETLPAAATHINLYGVGPIPGAADPGFIENDNTVSVTLTAGGGNHLATFTSMTSTGVNGTLGDDFTLATAEANKLNAIPKNGAAFSVTCDAAACPANSATGTVLNIITTDTPTTGLSPFAMPLPTTRRVQIRCGALGMSAISVPAEYSALIMGSGATRIQASFIRGALLTGGPPEISVAAGHAIVGFTN